ncbi:MAG: CoA transferase [Gammaproteobacteria bacterium]|nr:CoA transferase [Gammaproteobacteria bacterium]MBQ0838645.1 CoA transferase [Gammaproteobacteria bacterium]
MSTTSSPRPQGPLAGTKIIEFGGIGPGPLCSMLLSDAGATVLRLDRQTASGLGVPRGQNYDVQRRGRQSLAIDLKNPAAKEAILKLVESADGVLDPFRPGTLEKLGLGPDVLLARNPRLVFTRITGWGQSGPMAKTAGHDINYLSITGVLDAIGPKDGRPCPPLNVVADMGAGAMFSAFGMLAAIISARNTGRGQVVDSAMCDGSAYLAAGVFGMLQEGNFELQRESNLLDGGAPFYGTFETSDGLYMAIGAIERKFFDIAMDKLDIDGSVWGNHLDKIHWPQMMAQIKAAFATKTRDQWSTIFEGCDACVSPVLNFTEAMSYPHNVARNNLPEFNGVNQPAPAPVFCGTPGAIQFPPPRFGEHSEQSLSEWGFSDAEIAELQRQDAIGSDGYTANT